MHIDFRRVGPTLKVSRDLVLGKVSQEMIHAYYLSGYGFRDLNKKFSSPFRRERTPSAEVRWNRSGKLIFNDYGGKKGLDCFAVVQELFKLDFTGALNRIAEDFGIVSTDRAIDLRQIEWAKDLDKKVREDTLIQFELLDWDESTIQYWQQFYIGKEELEKDKDAFAIGSLFINKGNIANNGKPQFVYVMHDIGTPKVYFKIYRPYHKRKWYSNCPNHIPFGYRSLPYASDTVIITKSYKDMKVLRKFHTDVCATQNESVEAARFILELLKDRYKRFMLWYDADETGLSVAAELKDELSKVVTTPLQFSPLVKDPAGFINFYGPDALGRLTYQYLNR